jgi:hypothetical protein
MQCPRAPATWRLTFLAILFCALASEAGTAQAPPGPKGYPLTPIFGEDGAFETVPLDGRPVHRGVRGESEYPTWMYFRLPDGVPKPTGPAYVEVTYVDMGYGRLAIQYNAPGAQNAYRLAELGYNRILCNRKIDRTAVFRLATPDFRRGQNFQTDLRLGGPGGSVALHVREATLYLEPSPRFKEFDDKPWLRPYEGPSHSDINAKTLRGKVLCG